MYHLLILLVFVGSQPTSILSANGGWSNVPNTQYHIQTDEGPERYFRYQTQSGQYRKEKRLEDGTVVGTYGWVDANGYLSLRDYIADNQGYRILKTKNVFVGKNREIGQAVAAAKNAPATSGVLVSPQPKTPIYNQPSGGYSGVLGKQTPIYERPVTYTTVGLLGVPGKTFGGGYSTSGVGYPSSTPSYVSITPKPTPIAIYNPTPTPIAAYSSPSTTPIAGYSTPSPIDGTPHTPYVQISHNSVESSTESPTSTTFESSYSSKSSYQPSSTPATIYREPSTAFLPSTTISTTPSSILSLGSNDLDYQDPGYKKSSRYSNPYVYQNGPTYPIDRNGQTYNGYNNQIGNGYDPQFPLYDGVAVTNDGFRYYLPRQYHEEQNLPGDQRSGSFGYIDPFGIRRVIYYNTAPGTGFQHRKNNRYVGFNATPYDPRPYR